MGTSFCRKNNDTSTIDSLMIFKTDGCKFAKQNVTTYRIPTFHEDSCSWLIQSNGRKDQTHQ